MTRYILQRFGLMIITLLAISLATFILIQLPPGDFMTAYMANLATDDTMPTQAELDALRQRYGLDQPPVQQYFNWLWNVLHGDLGYSFQWNKPVSTLIWSRVQLTFAISLLALLVHWLIAFPIGIYSAVRQYSTGDYVMTTAAFISASVPHFTVALALMWFIFDRFGYNITGLYSNEFKGEPMSLAKFIDLIKHISIAVGILGVLGGAGLIRIMRANLLDELRKPYVVTARAKGLSEPRLIIKYPLRIALIPFISVVGWQLPGLISGTTIVAIVLGLPTSGPLLLRALESQDMYLAGSFLLILSALTIIGTFLSDMLLVWLDPRIQLTK